MLVYVKMFLHSFMLFTKKKDQSMYEKDEKKITNVFIPYEYQQIK